LWKSGEILWPGWKLPVGMLKREKVNYNPTSLIQERGWEKLGGTDTGGGEDKKPKGIFSLERGKGIYAQDGMGFEDDQRKESMKLSGGDSSRNL